MSLLGRPAGGHVAGGSFVPVVSASEGLVGRWAEKIHEALAVTPGLLADQ